jgi:hypothetical protein
MCVSPTLSSIHYGLAAFPELRRMFCPILTRRPTLNRMDQDSQNPTPTLCPLIRNPSQSR